MNRKRSLLVAILVGCGTAVATMSVTIPEHTLLSSANGMGLVTVAGYPDYDTTFIHGDRDPEGYYPYVVPQTVLEDLPTGIYTGTVSVVLGSSAVTPTESQLIGSCTVEVNAENGSQPIITWFDGTPPLGGP